MRFPRYPEYKESGVAWLGEVPAHWVGPVKLGAISSLKGRLGWQGLKADEYCDEGPLVVSSAHFSGTTIRWNECPHVSWERYQIDSNIQLCTHDILLMKDGAALGKLAFVEDLPGEACLNSHLLLFRPLKIELSPTYCQKFAFYFMQTSLFQEYMQTRGTGATFMGVSQEAISKFQVVWPPFSEQELIAAFLDHETAKIDALVAEQEKLIDLLKEKRQAVISHAVTKGLDPDVPMKDSGVEWLGEVPEHWGVKRLKRIAESIKAGPFGSALTKDLYVSAGYRVYGQEQVIPGDFTIGDYYIAEDRFKLMSDFCVCPNDVLISCVGTYGKIAVVPENIAPGIINPRLIRMRFKKVIMPNFISFVLKSSVIFEQFSKMSRGGTMDIINISTLSNIILPIPPLPEQRGLLKFINTESKKIDSLILESQHTIDLLKERRAALISAAVTGKIDVRTFHPELMEAV